MCVHVNSDSVGTDLCVCIILVGEPVRLYVCVYERTVYWKLFSCFDVDKSTAGQISVCHSVACFMAVLLFLQVLCNVLCVYVSVSVGHVSGMFMYRLCVCERKTERGRDKAFLSLNKLHDRKPCVNDTAILGGRK